METNPLHTNRRMNKQKAEKIVEAINGLAAAQACIRVNEFSNETDKVEFNKGIVQKLKVILIDLLTE